MNINKEEVQKVLDKRIASFTRNGRAWTRCGKSSDNILFEGSFSDGLKAAIHRILPELVAAATKPKAGEATILESVEKFHAKEAFASLAARVSKLEADVYGEPFYG